jgi:4-amino-4-deoxy-L-arabinose transferase-like glycosyltransferase
MDMTHEKNGMARRDWFFLGLILLGAVLFRMLLLSKVNLIGFDEVNYLKLAASGRINGLNHVLHGYWSPFYPLVVALLAYLVPDFELAGRLVQIFSVLILILLVFSFARKKFGKPIAFVTALLLAFYTLAARFSIKAETDFIYTTLAIAGVFLAWNALECKKVWQMFVSGLLFGLAYLTRPEGIGFLMVLWGVLFLVLIYQLFDKQKILKIVAMILLSGIGFGLAAAPYIFYLHRETGTWTISTKGTVNQQGSMYVEHMSEYQENPFHVVSEDDTKLMQDEIYHIGNFVTRIEEQGKPVVEVSPTALLKKMAENYYKIITSALTQVMTAPLLLLMGLGLFGAVWDSQRARLNLYLLSYVLFFWFILVPAFHINLRYFMPVMPLAFIWVAAGAVWFVAWGSGTLQKSVPKWPAGRSAKVVAVVGLTVVILGASVLPELFKRLGKAKHSTEEWAPAWEQKKAGLWLKEQGIKSPIMMAYNHAVSFYAGNYQIKESIEIPENKIDRCLAYARHRGAKYLVLDDRYKHHHPLIAHVYEQKDVPPDLKLIYSDKMQNGLGTLIYEILDPQPVPASSDSLEVTQ